MIDCGIVFGLLGFLLLLLFLSPEKFIFPDRWPLQRSSSDYNYGWRGSWSYSPMWANLRYYYPGSKKLMSKDIRGDPYIPYRSYSPWRQPSVFPLRNRQMTIGGQIY